MRTMPAMIAIAAVPLLMSACGRHGCGDLVVSGAPPREPVTTPQLPRRSCELSYEVMRDGRPLLPMTLRGRGGERRLQALLDTGDPGDVTIGARLARLGQLVGPVTTMESGTGPHRVCRVQFDRIAALGGSWTDPLINANLDRCDDSAAIGLGFFTGASGFIIDHANRSLTVLMAPAGATPAGIARAADGAWTWTPWRSSLTVGRAERVEGRSFSIETEWTIESSRPVLVAWVNGELVPCIVDTGAEAGLILHNTDLVPRRARPVHLRGHGGTIPGVRGRIDGVEIAGCRFDDVEVVVTGESGGATAGSGAHGVVGMGLLARQPVWLDFENERIGFGARAR